MNCKDRNMLVSDFYNKTTNKKTKQKVLKSKAACFWQTKKQQKRQEELNIRAHESVIGWMYDYLKSL